MPIDLLERFAGEWVLVLGDALLDRWLTGHPNGLCREGPVAVVDLDGTRYACGGTGNTAVCSAAGLAAALAAGVVDAGELGRLVAGYRAAGRRIVFTNGVFDVLHRGHSGTSPRRPGWATC